MKVIYLMITFVWITEVYPQYIPQYTLQPQFYITQPSEFSSNALYDPVFISPQPLITYPNIPQLTTAINETAKSPEKNDDSVEVEASAILKRLEIPVHMTPAANNYRGFGYHNKYSNEGSSTVIFLTGPPVSNQIPEKLRITVASDSLDPQIPHIEERLGNIFNQQSEMSTSPFSPIVKTLVANANIIPQVYHFYAEPSSSIETNGLKAESKNVENKIPKEEIEGRSSEGIATANETSSTTLASTTVINNENQNATTLESTTNAPDEEVTTEQDQTTKV